MASSYVLKDRKAQSALERIFPGFIKALSFDTHPDGVSRICVLASMASTKGKAWFFSIPNEDVETVESYSPRGWNGPDTVPPENIPMCVELRDEFGHLFRRIGVYRIGEWKIENPPESGSIRIERFRPWED